MSENCPTVPPVESGKTPKERVGLTNAHKLKAFVQEGLATDTLPLHNGLMNRKKVAEELGFARSAYAQNETIKDIADWADKELKGKPRKTGESAKSKLERDLSQENQRLKDRNVTLKVQVDEAERKLKELSYTEKALKNGENRLPW